MAALNNSEIVTTLVIYFILALIGIACSNNAPVFTNIVRGFFKNRYGTMLIFLAFAMLAGLALTGLGDAQPYTIGFVLVVVALITLNYWYRGSNGLATAAVSSFRANILVMLLLIVIMIGCSALVIDDERMKDIGVRAATGTGVVIFWALFIYVVWQSKVLGNTANLLNYPVLLVLLVLLSCYVFSKISGIYTGWLLLVIMLVIGIASAVTVGYCQPFAKMFSWKDGNPMAMFLIVYTLVFTAIFNLAVTYANKFPVLADGEAVSISMQAFSVTMFVLAVVALIVATVYVHNKNGKKRITSDASGRIGTSISPTSSFITSPISSSITSSSSTITP
jgi:MFS family permease